MVAVFAVVALCAASPGSGLPLEPPLVDATLVADVHSIAPGVPFHLGVRFEMKETWHINWINPGDAGLAPSVEWRLPEGFHVEPLQWPHPGRYMTGPLAIFGYEGTVTLWTTVTPPNYLAAGARVTLAASTDWLACQEACVPGRSEPSLELPVESTARIDTAATRSLRGMRHRVPVSIGDWTLAASYGTDEVEIQIDPVDPTRAPAVGGVHFFPDVPGIIENAATQRVESTGAGLRLFIPRSRMVGATPARLTGVLVAPGGWDADGTPAVRVDIPLQPR